MQYCVAFSPLHTRPDIVEQALSILVFCSQGVLHYELTFLQRQLFVKLYNLNITRTLACFSVFRCLQIDTLLDFQTTLMVAGRNAFQQGQADGVS